MLALESIPDRFQILIVDDDAGVRGAMSALLAIRGHSVISAESGGQALQLLGAYLPSLIISDIDMPLMNGYQLVKELRVRLDTRFICVIAMTGGNYTSKLSLDAGFDGHVCKPVQIQQMLMLFDVLRFRGPSWKGFVDSDVLI